MLPAWAAPKRLDEVPRLWPALQPNGVPDSLDDSPGPYEGLERDAARERSLPQAVWLSLVLALFGRIFTFGLSGITGLILGIVLPVTGLILGMVGRSQIKASSRHLDRLIWANVAIALHLVGLILVLSAISRLPTFLAR